MHPIFLSLGPLTIYYFSLFFILSCAIFSFLFWRALRDLGVDEEKIFDLTLYSGIAAIIGARSAYVVTHWSIFSADWLRILAIWVTPGLSLYGGFLAGALVAYLLLKPLKIRLAWVVDSFAISFPLALIFGRIGSLLDGSEVGRVTSLKFGVNYIGHTGLRHPVQLYEIFGLLIILLVLLWLKRRPPDARLKPGLLGPLAISLTSFWFFLLEFLKERSVYWAGVSPNQWLLVFIFAQSLGMILVRNEYIKRRFFKANKS